MRTLTSNISFIVGSLAIALVGCAGEAADEGIESDTSGLDKGCVDKIQAKVGSPAWKAALEACVAEAKAGGGAGGQAGKPGQSQQGSSSSAKGCSVAVQCNNGACQCSAGPKKGTACDGKSATGANSCSVVCAYDC